MKRLIMAALIGFGLVLVLPPAESGAPRPAVCQVITYIRPDPNPYHRQYEEMLYPCVRITTAEGIGSGVVISATHSFHSVQADFTDYILTAAHVVGKESVVRCEMFRDTGCEICDASVVITDTTKDLALLKLNLPNLHNLRLYPAHLAPKDYTPYLFAPIWVVGCSLGLPPRPSQGIVTALQVSSWEVSAPILPGNSGGPVYDAKTYQVIGIAVRVKVYQGQLVTTMAGIVPIQTIYEFLEKAR